MSRTPLSSQPERSGAIFRLEVDVGCIDRHDANLVKLAEAIAVRVGAKRFDVWFDKSTRLELRNDSLEITVADEFVGEWIQRRFGADIQDAAMDVLGAQVQLRFHVQPDRFNGRVNGHSRPDGPTRGDGSGASGESMEAGKVSPPAEGPAVAGAPPVSGAPARSSPPPDSATSFVSGTHVAAPAPGPASAGAGPTSAASTNARLPATRHAPPPTRSSSRQPSARTGSSADAGDFGRADSTAASAPSPVVAAPVASVASAPFSPAPSVPFIARSIPQADGRVAPATDAARPRTTQLPPSARPRLRHDLESYVVGPSNQLAFSAAVHVAQFPGAQYNPLFVHGGCGLGKTHLLQGLCNRFHKLHPTRRWLYLTGEEFTNDYVAAVKSGKIETFRRRIRDVDLLVIDDVHFFSGKKATQEEFLHTFNAIEASGRQVVMASDCHPRDIAEFGESLVNRFISGMVVRVEAPTFQMRCDILRRLADRQGVRLGDDVVTWVARRVTQNVRELEGALNRILALVQLGLAGSAMTALADGVAVPTRTSASQGSGISLSEPVTLALAQQALGDLDRAMVAPLRPEAVISTVAAYFGLDVRELMSGKRHHAVSLARSVAMYLIRKTARLSFPEIGAKLGNRNHSTVISACRRVESAVQANETLRWVSQLGPRSEDAAELVQRLEEQARAAA